MAWVFTIGKKEIEIEDETMEKVTDVLATVSIGCSMFLLGHVFGQRSGLTRGYSIGVLSGAAQAYDNVVEALKMASDL